MKNTLIAIVLCLACAFAYSACSGKPRPTDLRSSMRSNYASTAKLYQYVWSPEEFTLHSNQTEILSLLDQQIKNFHQFNLNDSPPGVPATAQAQLSMLTDIRQRFAEGSKDYANWRLRGLTSACISCHARFEVKSDFIGSGMQATEASYEARLAAAEFLLASRQFTKARDELFRLAISLGQNPTHHSQMMTALKLWLFVEVEIKARVTAPLNALKELEKKVQLDAESAAILSQWKSDLVSLQHEGDNLKNFSKAKTLLEAVEPNRRIYDDELNLVKTLRAAAILNRTLQHEDHDSVEYRQADFLLAVAYSHLPISTLEVYQVLYLEQCIRRYPQTAEAQKAYKLFEEQIQEQSSGSSGLHLDEADQSRLKELKALAFGTSKTAA